MEPDFGTPPHPVPQRFVLGISLFSEGYDINTSSTPTSLFQTYSLGAAGSDVVWLRLAVKETWMPVSLWHGWSQKGCLDASQILQTPVEGILPTTNHLEAFNSLLKHKYISQLQHAGKRLCLDVFVYMLIMHIVPDMFSVRRTQESYYSWISERFWADLVAACCARLGSAPSLPKPTIPMVWWSADSQGRHHDESKYIITHSQISDVHWIDAYTLEATCASSVADIQSHGCQQYNLRLSVYGWGCCSCIYFKSNKGACKHLWALCLNIPKLVEAKQIAPASYTFCFPATESEACEVYTSCFHTTDILPLLRPSSTSTPASKPSGSNALSTSAYVEKDTDEGVIDSDPESDDENDSLRMASCNHEGIGLQLQCKIDHQTHSILPQIHGLVSSFNNIATQLVDVLASHELEELDEACSKLHEHLSHLRLMGQHEGEQLTTISTRPPPKPSQNAFGHHTGNREESSNLK
ncbi:hypothetical protein K439DRAFT_1611009 [Ramaria rubella]|nr:hypothetical protein K439DRAFT_1611009 [Ramaria rubella]